MTASFRQHCASALTHSVTIAAVAVLLANDLAFKLIWPDHWATGKLSDLSWVVFAPPLLALLLSFVTFWKPSAERAAFTVAYAGLPLAYAAFNSSETVHGWALALLLPLTGSAAGSPFDPTDSLVILPGLALALWIWRQAPARPESTRMRLSLFAAVAASLATVATSGYERSSFEWQVGISVQGTVVMHGPYTQRYESSDGGITWVKVSGRRSLSVAWGNQEAATPRGTYAVQGFDIVLLHPEGQPTVAYPTGLQEESNQWAQKYVSRNLRSDLTGPYDDPDRFLGKELLNIVYHPRTSNVIVAMGLEGVLVGNPNGAWTRIAVGEFVPTDFSFPGKARLMLSTPPFWLGILSFALLFTTLALAFSARAVSGADSLTDQHSRPPAHRIRTHQRVWAILLLVVVALAVFSGGYLFTLLLLPALCPLAAFTLTRFALTKPRENTWRILTALLFAVIGTVLALIAFPPYRSVSAFLSGYIDWNLIVASAGLGFAILAAAIYFPRKGERTAYWVTLASMVALVPTPFLLWLSGGIALPVASLGALVLLALIAGVFYRCLTKRRRAND